MHFPGSYVTRSQRTTLINRYASRLGWLVKQRHTELALSIAKDDAERAARTAECANRAKTEFLAKMSHEIRTPMNGVLGMTDLLSRTELTDRQRKFVSTARQSAETLLNLINDILDFSRIEAGKVELRHADFDVRGIVGDVIDLLAESAQSKGLEIAYHFSRAVPQGLRGDSNRLRQIVFNLVGNAIKFTDQGEVVVRVDADQVADESVVLSFEVTDTGIGIPLEAMQHILQPFEQADGSITRRFGGAGLGLTITRQLIEMMDGELSIDSTPGSGSTFRFTVRLEPAAAAYDQDLVPQSSLEGTKVLIVDDNVTNREILHYCLSEWSMVSESAADGYRALQMLRVAANRSEPFDLVLLDMMMPGMSGIAVAQAIKKEPSLGSTQLIVLTSMGRDGSLDEAWPSNIHAFLTKPVRQTELYDQIKRVMSVAVEQTVSPDQGFDATEPEPTDGEPMAGAIVLLAEDNPVNQEVMREYLMALGCRVEVVETGLQAVAAFEHTIYDIIFMDCQMPDMDGLDATMMLRLRERQQNRQPRTPIIAVTADAFEAQRERCLEAGMDDYLRKPFDQNDLSAILQRWLNQGEPLAATKCESDVGARAPIEEPSDFEYLTQCEDIDSSALSNIASLNRGGSSENVDDIIRIYLDITPKYLADLRAAINASDVLSTERTAHKLKSSSATLGATKLAAQCRDLEHLAHAKTLDYALLHLSQIESSFEKIRGIFSASIESQVQLRKRI